MNKALDPWLDLDGVLVDLNKGLAAELGLAYPSEGITGHDWSLRMTGMQPLEFFQRMDELPSEFWAELPAFPWTSDLVQFLDLEFPGWQIVSHAVRSPTCWGGKAEWVRRFLGPDNMGRLHLLGYGSTKSSLAGPRRLLVDDWTQNCQEWRAAGGHAFNWIPYAAGDPRAPGMVRALHDFLLGRAPS